MAETIPIVENAIREHGLGEIENPPKPGIHPGKAFIHAMPGYLPRKKAAGLKWVSSFSNNTALALPPVMGLFILMPNRYFELGEIVAGKKPGRRNEKERIIDFNYGLAIEDVAMAMEIYTRAKTQGVGTVLPLMEGDLPYA